MLNEHEVFLFRKVEELPSKFGCEEEIKDFITIASKILKNRCDPETFFCSDNYLQASNSHYFREEDVVYGFDIYPPAKIELEIIEELSEGKSAEEFKKYKEALTRVWEELVNSCLLQIRVLQIGNNFYQYYTVQQ